MKREKDIYNTAIFPGKSTPGHESFDLSGSTSLAVQTEIPVDAAEVERRSQQHPKDQIRQHLGLLPVYAAAIML